MNYNTYSIKSGGFQPPPVKFDSAESRKEGQQCNGMDGE